MSQTVVTQGIFNSQQFVPNLAKHSFAGMITQYQPAGTAPLFGLTSMLPEVTAINPEHSYWSKAMVFPAFELTANVSASDTTFKVASTKNLLPGQVHRMEETQEQIIINTVVDANTIIVTRGVGSTAAAINISSDIIDAYQVGNAFEEGSIRPQAMSTQPVNISNFTQIFRNTWSLTGTAGAMQTVIGESPVASNRQDCSAFHAADIEKAIIFGKKSQGFRNGMPFRTMDGLLSVIGNVAYYPPSFSVPNVYQAQSTTNSTQLEAMLDPVFDQATDPKVANERILLVGGKARIVLNNIGKKSGTYQLIDGQTAWGLQFSTLRIARGTFRIIEHPLFNTNSHWSRMVLAVDLSTFNIAYLAGRKTAASEFGADGRTAEYGLDAVGGSLLTECTTEIRNPPANAVITGLTAAGAEV